MLLEWSKSAWNGQSLKRFNGLFWLGGHRKTSFSEVLEGASEMVLLPSIKHKQMNQRLARRGFKPKCLVALPKTLKQNPRNHQKSPEVRKTLVDFPENHLFSLRTTSIGSPTSSPPPPPPHHHRLLNFCHLASLSCQQVSSLITTCQVRRWGFTKNCWFWAPF